MRAPPRIEAREFLDGPAQDPVAFAGLLADIRRVNRWYGGRTLVLSHLEAFSRRIPHRPLRILDVATGSGDMPAEMVRWARARGIPLRILAVDIHPEILAVARALLEGVPEVILVRADARALPLADRSVDVVFCGLALHHFCWADAVRVLREVDRVAAGGYVVHDVLRTWAAYLGVLADTWILGRSRLSRHDGPLSVLRAYTLEELEALVRAAGLRNAEVRRHRFQRGVIVRWPEERDGR
ncbi:MAG: methyltransferase domain-containing protein [Armatimonadota bacterium]|nr:methyltransferase domain-containing protein [Armatimonadota bacterium]MDR7444312.1 methyltransferase domain-containing protein [Armatimonadota bacterium]MDR7569697.1 methyltransferase domain-containing protein [Armatimonadota bacterium]MDR7614799.1 methyltransferase domain-containing protein [Armatimonadota bacterium]